MRLSATGFPLSLAIASGPATVGLGALGGLEPAGQVVLMLGACLLATGAVLWLSPRPALTPAARLVPVALGLFAAALALSNILADLDRVRPDRADMWRQSVMALGPAVLLLAGQRWAASCLAVRDVDRAVTLVAAICLLSVLLEVTGLHQVESYGDRHFGFIGDSVAWYLSFCAVYGVARARLPLAAAAILALLLTQSRGALVVAGAGLLIVLLLSGLGLRRKILGSAALGLVLALVTVAFPDQVAGISERFTAVDPLDNDRVRTTAFSLLVWEARPVFGSGYNAHSFAFAKAGLLPPEGREFWGTATSTPVQILADAGVVGFGFFLLFALLAVILALRAIGARRDPRERAALTGLGAWVVAFLLLNHSAAWLLPGSGLGPLVFAAAGIVSGAAGRLGPAAQPAG